MKKTKYWKFICPVCGWETVGNSKDLLQRVYHDHYLTDHYHDPYIKPCEPNN